MPKCPDCNTDMKVLFSGFYCPQDCDKPGVKEARAATEATAAKARSYGWGGLAGWIPQSQPVAYGGPDPACQHCAVVSAPYSTNTNSAGTTYWYKCAGGHQWYVPLVTWDLDKTPVNLKDTHVAMDYSAVHQGKQAFYKAWREHLRANP